MPDAVEFVKTMKKTAVDAVEATKPVFVYFGEVTSVTPLQINVEQKMMLGEAQLILTRNVTDFVTSVSVNWESEESLKTHHKHTLDGNTETGGEPAHDHTLTGETETADLKHSHTMAGKKRITIHNALSVGEQVVIIRQQEGQKFIVVDRIGGK